MTSDLAVIFLDMTPKIQSTKEKITWISVKVKKFCASRKRCTSPEWEKIFINHTCNKGQLLRIYKELLLFYYKKTNCPIKKWAKGSNRHLFKEYIHVTNKHTKRYLTLLLVIGEMQVKITKPHTH